MQNFMEIGPVVFAAEYVGMKNGCTSYNTSQPVDATINCTLNVTHFSTGQREWPAYKITRFQIVKINAVHGLFQLLRIRRLIVIFGILKSREGKIKGQSDSETLRFSDYRE